MAQSAQSVEAYVAEQMDNASMGPIHWRVLALVASGLFFDVMDFTIFGALVPDLIASGFVTSQQQVPWIGSVTVAGLFVGTLGQGDSTDRFGRKAVYQAVQPGLLFGLATIIAALPPIPTIGFDPGYKWLLDLSSSSPESGSGPSNRCVSHTSPSTSPKRVAKAASRRSCRGSSAALGRGRSACC